MKEILDRVPGQAELREYRDRDALFGAGPRLAQSRLGVCRRIGNRRARRAGGNSCESLFVDAAEIHD
jgi:hypothetical protein